MDLSMLRKKNQTYITEELWLNSLQRIKATAQVTTQICIKSVSQEENKSYYLVVLIIVVSQRLSGPGGWAAAVRFAATAVM